jgi:hypothetical protein
MSRDLRKQSRPFDATDRRGAAPSRFRNRTMPMRCVHRGRRELDRHLATLRSAPPRARFGTTRFAGLGVWQRRPIILAEFYCATLRRPRCRPRTLNESRVTIQTASSMQMSWSRKFPDDMKYVSTYDPWLLHLVGAVEMAGISVQHTRLRSSRATRSRIDGKPHMGAPPAGLQA